MRDEEECAFIDPECFFERFSCFIVEMIRRFIENKEMVWIFTEECEEESRSFSS
jgi:hypothetical protein